MSGHALVTGAAGFIGSHLCEDLLSDDWQITAIDSFSPTYETMLRRGVVGELRPSPIFRFIEGDLLKIDLADLLNDVDVVFHLAARPGVRASWEDFQWSLDANVMATKKLLYAMVRAESSARLVFASSSSVYGAASQFPTKETFPLRPISPYGVTKASAEQLVNAYATQFGIDAVMLRYFTVFGPRQRTDMAFTRWIAAALTGRPLHVFGDGTAVRDFTFVSDAVDATIRSIEAPPGVYNVAGGSPAGLNEAIDAIRTAVGRNVEVVYSVVAAGDPKRTGGDTSRIEAAVGWSPSVSLEEGIKLQVDWLSSV